METKKAFGQGLSLQIPLKAKHNKYNAIKTAYKGEMYDSKHEAAHAQRLDTLRKAEKPEHRVVKIERQVPFSFDYNFDPTKPKFHICKMIVDFKVTYADGHVEYHDPKGMETREASIKRKLAKAFYGIDVKFI